MPEWNHVVDGDDAPGAKGDQREIVGDREVGVLPAQLELVVAGGETSGAVVQSLGITSLRIGPQIDPGVPAVFADGKPGGRPSLALALKSGNFGARDFFTKALDALR